MVAERSRPRPHRPPLLRRPLGGAPVLLRGIPHRHRAGMEIRASPPRSSGRPRKKRGGDGPRRPPRSPPIPPKRPRTPTPWPISARPPTCARAVRPGPKAFRRLLLERPGSDWTRARLCPSPGRAEAPRRFPQEELHALAMRDAVWRKDYGLAYQEALLGPSASMGRAASQAMIADAGKAFLYSGQLKEGEEAIRGPSAGRRAIYRARFARALERWEEAASALQESRRRRPDAGRRGRGAMVRRRLRIPRGPCSRERPIGCGDPRNCRTAVPAAGCRARSRAGRARRRIEALEGPRILLRPRQWPVRDALNERDWQLIEDMAERLGPSWRRYGRPRRVCLRARLRAGPRRRLGPTEPTRRRVPPPRPSASRP